MTEVLSSFVPNKILSKNAIRTLIVGQLILFLIYWQLGTPDIIPKPLSLPQTIGNLLQGGFANDLIVSLTLYAESLVIAALYSFLLSVATALAFFQPIASLWAKLRFLGMTGLPFILTLYIHSAHWLKVFVIAFSISVFFVTGMLDVIASIPKEKFDLARTLRLSEWQVVWEVIVRGRLDVAFDVLRQNAAIGWFMLPMAEALWKSEGGIGALLDIQNKHFGLEAVAAIQVVILLVGLSQDYLLGVIKNIVCPYAKLILVKR